MMTAYFTGEPIDVPAIVSDLHSATAGAVVTFEGCTRADFLGDAEVVALNYEAHESLATKQMMDLITQAGDRWPLTAAVVVHRTGRVAVGEASVLIAVAAPHRGEAFDACRWLIDTLKQSVAIWKQEVLSTGNSHWVNSDSAHSIENT